MKTYIIRLSDNKLSCDLAEQSKISAETLGINSEYFEGIKREEVQEFFSKNSISFNKFQDKTHWSLGTMGCFASHWSLWNMCAESNESFTIMEHDGVLIRDPSIIENDIEDVCHLDQFIPFMSSFGEESEKYFEVYDKSVYERNESGVMDYPSSDFYGSKSITGSCFRGLYGYMIKPQGARKVLDFCKKYGAFPADRMMCENAVRLQRSNSTYVRLNPFFKSIKIQRDFSTR